MIGIRIRKTVIKTIIMITRLLLLLLLLLLLQPLPTITTTNTNLYKNNYYKYNK